MEFGLRQIDKKNINLKPIAHGKDIYKGGYKGRQVEGLEKEFREHWEISV